MLSILILIGLLFFLFRVAQLRGLLFGIVLAAFIGFLTVLSRFHLRKSVVLLGALFFTALLLGLLGDYLKSRKK